VRVVRRVPPGAFQPPPKVDSAVVALEPRPPELPPAQEARFLEHVKGLFTRRRKLMLSTLKALGAGGPQSDWAAVECLVGQSRPEVLSPEEHLAVFRCLHPEPPGGP
jgi:16S rRNA (adenine1518-N6/adenine1519-N6)-dimethyltransferase